MVDDSNRTTIVRETEKSSGGLAFIVGGLVVAVGLIAWFMWGDGMPAGDGGNTTITIENPAPAPAAEAPAEPAPAAPPAAAPAAP